MRTSLDCSARALGKETTMVRDPELQDLGRYAAVAFKASFDS
jgi:hypothetical protein